MAQIWRETGQRLWRGVALDRRTPYFVKLQRDMINVKEFRDEGSTLNHVSFLSKNLDHISHSDLHYR